MPFPPFVQDSSRQKRGQKIRATEEIIKMEEEASFLAMPGQYEQRISPQLGSSSLVHTILSIRERGSLPDQTPSETPQWTRHWSSREGRFYLWDNAAKQSKWEDVAMVKPPLDQWRQAHSRPLSGQWTQVQTNHLSGQWIQDQASPSSVQWIRAQSALHWAASLFLQLEPEERQMARDLVEEIFYAECPTINTGQPSQGPAAHDTHNQGMQTIKEIKKKQQEDVFILEKIEETKKDKEEDIVILEEVQWTHCG